MNKKEKTRQYNKEYYHKVRKHKKKDKKKINEYHKEWRSKNKEKWKRYQTCHRYGISTEEYEDLIESSGKSCPICNTLFDDSKYKRNIDHCHETGIVRGIICNHCNVALGWFKHDEDILRRAISWIKIN